MLQYTDDVCFVVFAFFNVAWATLYLEHWKRRSAVHAYRWGTLDKEDELLVEPRALFYVSIHWYFSLWWSANLFIIQSDFEFVLWWICHYSTARSMHLFPLPFLFKYITINTHFNSHFLSIWVDQLPLNHSEWTFVQTLTLSSQPCQCTDKYLLLYCEYIWIISAVVNELTHSFTYCTGIIIVKGRIVRSPVTGRYEPFYPAWRRNLFRYLVSLPVVGICLSAVFATLWGILELQSWVNIRVKSGSAPFFCTYLPKVLLAISIPVLDDVYKRIALWLNNKGSFLSQLFTVSYYSNVE